MPGILRYAIHLLLFLLTFFTTTLAGVTWVGGDFTELSNFPLGLPYSLSILSILAAHEFGHYFTARAYGVQASLPYFIPVPHFLINPFGTMGAVIRIRSPLMTKQSLFDIGIAGPIAGLAVTVGVLLYGFSTLPGVEYLYQMHADFDPAADTSSAFSFGTSLFFFALPEMFELPGFFPPMSEIYHYPYLCAGWFGMFITAVNLMPVGQLDGGHILYALTGSVKQALAARIFFGILVGIGIAGFLPFIPDHYQIGTTGWLLWAIIMFFVVKLRHPDVLDESELSHGRRLLGWSTMLLFVLIFPPIPFMGFLAFLI